MSDSIRVNGDQYSWGSIYFKIDGERYYGFTAISYADKRERVKAYGMGKHHAPRGRSRGKYTVEPVKVTGWKGSVQVLRDKLASQASDGKSYGNVQFQGVVQYIEENETEIVVELDRLVWASNTTSEDESPDPLKEDFELDCMLIRRNDRTLYDGTEGQP